MCMSVQCPKSTSHGFSTSLAADLEGQVLALLQKLVPIRHAEGASRYEWPNRQHSSSCTMCLGHCNDVIG